MTGILDYIIWRGDLPFCETAPVNTVDLLIFSQLIHAPFEGLQDATGTLFSLKDQLFLHPEEEEKAGGMRAERIRLWKMMEQYPRFAGVRLLRFDAAFDEKSEMQFAGALFAAGDTAVLAFRGTDGTLTGWKEDFNLCFADWVPSQMRALTFLNGVLPLLEKEGIKKLEVCGHSKGGNLAMFAASQCLRPVAALIRHVTAFDAPGLCEHVLATPGWQEMQDKLRLYIPESSVIGLLLDTGAPKKIVDSDSVSLMQHNPFLWHIQGTQLCLVKETTLSSRITDQVLDEFLKGLSAEKRRCMVDALFDVLCVCNVKQVKELPLALLTHRNEIRRVMADRPEEERGILTEMFTRLVTAGGESLLQGLIR